MKKLLLLLFIFTLFAFSGNVEQHPTNTLSFTSTVKYFCYVKHNTPQTGSDVGIFIYADANGDKHEVNMSICGTSSPFWDHMFVIIIQVEHPYTCHISGHLIPSDFIAGINVNGDCSNIVQIENEYPEFYESYLLNWGT